MWCGDISLLALLATPFLLAGWQRGSVAMATPVQLCWQGTGLPRLSGCQALHGGAQVLILSKKLCLLTDLNKQRKKKPTIFICLLSGFWRPWQSSLHFNKCFYDTIPQVFFCGCYYCNFCTVFGSELKTSPLSYPCSPCSIKLPSKGKVDRWVNASQRLLCYCTSLGISIYLPLCAVLNSS